MPKVKFTKKFLKDFDRHVAGKGGLQGELEILIQLIEQGNPLPAGYSDHPLKGNLKGIRDCHLRGDLVVLYEKAGETARFLRLGTHSEIFG